MTCELHAHAVELVELIDSKGLRPSVVESYLESFDRRACCKPKPEIKTTFTNHSSRIWSEEEARVMVNAALAKLIDDAGGVITISVKDLFRVAPMRTLAMALSDDDKILTLTRIPRDS